jgi:hypothetical protein
MFHLRQQLSRARDSLPSKVRLKCHSFSEQVRMVGVALAETSAARGVDLEK